MTAAGSGIDKSNKLLGVFGPGRPLTSSFDASVQLHQTCQIQAAA
jgi:hypothetical protein